MPVSILRLSRFRPLWPSYDAALRAALIPDLLQRPGLLAIFAGRAGIDNDGPRMVASLWASQDAMHGALGADLAHPHGPLEALDSIADLEIEAFDLALAFPPAEATNAGIVRIVHGRTKPGRLPEYVAEAKRGTLADADKGVGPLALYLGAAEPDGFVTLSLWDSWSHLGAATGSDLEDVARTRHAELLETWSAEHFEVVPGTMTIVRDIPEGQLA